MSILAIDDDADTLSNLRDILELDGHRVTTAGSAHEALALSAWPEFAAIVVDRRLPEGDAVGWINEFKRLAPEAGVIIVTGHADVEGVIQAIRAGAADYITKPVNPDLIRKRLAQIFERRESQREIHRLNSDLRHRVMELQTLLDVLPVGIAITKDPACRWIQSNPALAKLLGMAQSPNVSFNLPGSERLPFRAYMSGRELNARELPLQRTAATGREIRGEEIEIIRSTGEKVLALSYVAPLRDDLGNSRGAVGAFLDITERKHAQEQAMQNERLAAIGQMMAGLAHESGNALARSQSCLEMLSWEVEDRPTAVELIRRIQNAQDHLRQLYEEVRNYAAPVQLELELWDVGSVWRQAWDNLSLQREDREASLEEWAFDADLKIRCDPFRLEQVFRNAFENSLAACADPVRVFIHCRNTAVDGPTAKRGLEIRIGDNGPGFSEDQRRNVFEPFFTTKPKGTGLGMAIAKRIVEAHGGTIAADRSEHGGAEIALWLPRD